MSWSQTDSLNIDAVFEKALSFHYINKDSAYYFYEKTIELANEQDNLDYLLGSLGYLINANNNFYDLEGFGHNIIRMDKLLYNDRRIDGFYAEQYYKERLLFDKGNYHYKLTEYATAQKYFLELYAKIKSIPENELEVLDVETMSGIYSFLGLIHRHTGKYEQAEFYYKKDIEWVNEYKDSLADWQSALFNTKKLLSQVYEIQNKSESANVLLKDALQFYRSRIENPRYKNNFLTTYILLAKNQIQLDDYDGAISVLDENQLDDPQNNQFSKEIDVLYGDIFLGKNNYKKAESFYKKALKAYQEYRQHKPHQDIAEVHGKIAEFHLKKENYSEGLEALQKALNSSGRNIKINNAQQNPEPEKVFSKKQLLELLNIKLQLLQFAYSKTDDKQYLDAAIQTNKDILSTFDLLKKEFESKLDKQFLAQTAYPIFHRMLSITYEAYEKDSSTEIFELALNISEKNKDFLLLEAIRNASATQYGNVPSEIIEKEAQLRAGISNLEKNLFDATNEESNFSEDLFKLKQEYFGFLDTLETKYPKYHDLKYQSQTLNLSAIGNSLDDDEILVSFTMTEDYLFALVLDDDSQDFAKLPFDESDRGSVRDFYRLLSSPSITDNSTAISESGKHLFEKILQRPLANFKNENLTIIPDDVLHYLPFDLLVEDNEILLKSNFIGYGNSISSYLQLKEKEKGTAEKLLAFAPSFEGEVIESEVRFEFGKLLYNDDEVKKISNAFETEAYIDSDATLENFRKKAPEFKMIHLATHASANDEYPDYSYLAFSKNGDESNILYIKDLYNTTLNAEMVTLSACQTGIGKLQKGQGMMSLSKGFFYAGAKSLVNTLWKINDKSSVKLMEYFYEGLSNGKNKKEALRDAKLKYLASTDDNLLKHPYYWSAFVVSGNTTPIVKTSYWWYLSLLGIFLFSIACYKMYNRHK